MENFCTIPMLKYRYVKGGVKTLPYEKSKVHQHLAFYFIESF